MIRPRWWLVAPALLASAVLSSASAAEIRDKAKIFSPEAVKKAEADLTRLEKEYDVPVIIETISTLDGEKVARVLDRHAQAVNAEGVYILIAKNDHDLEAGASKHFTQYLTRDRLNAVQKAFSGEFKGGNFDAGLSQAVEKMDAVLSDAKADAGGSIRQKSAPNARRGGVVAPARPVPVRKSSGGFSLLTLIIGGLALFFLFRIIGAVFRAMRGNQYGGGQMMGGRGGYPGPGGPGYGGGYGGGAPAGGGGFMSSLFGGIGGAMAGNWLYDKMSGGHPGGGYADQTGYDGGAAPVEDASPDWNTSSADATNWGDSGAADTSSAGGDWGGGGGGGDWGGGGGGGGDWGGGGGSDDNGGSW